VQVDEAAAELWDITDRELKEIRRSLEELRKYSEMQHGRKQKLVIEYRTHVRAYAPL
jgi:hypothetical protein